MYRERNVSHQVRRWEERSGESVCVVEWSDDGRSL